MQIIFHRKSRIFLESLEKTTYAKAIRLFELLETQKHELQMPYAKWVERDLYELRIQARQEVRFFYTFFHECIHVLHGFFKTSNKIPKHELQTARSRLITLHRV